MRKIYNRLMAAVGLGLIGSSVVDAQEFDTVNKAQKYLAENPTGPLAEDAFRVVVDANIKQDNPEYSIESLSGSVLSFSGNIRIAQIGSILDGSECVVEDCPQQALPKVY